MDIRVSKLRNRVSKRHPDTWTPLWLKPCAKILTLFYIKSLHVTPFWPSFSFYLRYEIDDTSPFLCDPINDDDYCYEILSKTIQTKKTAPATKPDKTEVNGHGVVCN